MRYFLLIIILCFSVGFTTVSCRKKNPYQERMTQLKSKLDDLIRQNELLEDKYYEVKKTKRKAIERKIKKNEKKMARIQRALGKMTKGKQMKILNAIKGELNSRGD